MEKVGAIGGEPLAIRVWQDQGEANIVRGALIRPHLVIPQILVRKHPKIVKERWIIEEIGGWLEWEMPLNKI